MRIIFCLVLFLAMYAEMTSLDWRVPLGGAAAAYFADDSEMEVKIKDIYFIE